MPLRSTFNLDQIAIKTFIKSYLPSGDLIKYPYQDLEYLGLWETAQYKVRSLAPPGLSEEEIIWIDKLALRTSVSIKTSNPNWLHGYFLYEMVKNYTKNYQNKTINYFETGTAKGFSALVAAKAITTSGNKPQITTIDIINDNKKRYWNAMGDINGKRNRNELLSDYEDLIRDIHFLKLRSRKLNRTYFGKNEIDLAFLDGPHTYRNVKNEFEFVISKLVPGGILLFDDYNQSKYPGIYKFVNELNPKNIEKIIGNNRNYALYINN